MRVTDLQHGIAPRDALADHQIKVMGCRFAREWKLDLPFALKVAAVAWQFERETSMSLRILSGHRTIERQLELEQEGKGARPDLSNHTLCPAHAVDVWPSGPAVPSVRATLGRIAVFEGLRWGGCQPDVAGCIDPDTLMPQDWNHLDDGPRAFKTA